MNEILRISIDNLKSQKLRTGLTLLGIVIGIGAIVGLITLSDGLEGYIMQSMEDFGANKLIIVPGGSNMGMATTFYFDDSDVDVIKSVSGVDTAGGMDYGRAIIGFKDESFGLSIVGIETETSQELWEGAGVNIAKGKLPDAYHPGDIIIGWRVHKHMFKSDVNIRDRLEVNGQAFKVVGIFEEIGNPEDDSTIFIDTQDFSEVMGVPVHYIMIMAVAKEGTDPNKVADDITRRLGRQRDEEDFEIMTSESLLEQIGEVFGIMQVVLGAIAGISLVVAGIGIMNTMLMAVIERTKEIGIMKAVGANRRQILQIFLTETVILSLLGGLFGLTLGAIIAKIVSSVAAGYGLKMLLVISPKIVLLAFGFALIVGTVSGLYPAWKAAKMNPVDAIHYG